MSDQYMSDTLNLSDWLPDCQIMGKVMPFLYLNKCTKHGSIFHKPQGGLYKQEIQKFSDKEI